MPTALAALLPLELSLLLSLLFPLANLASWGQCKQGVRCEPSWQTPVCRSGSAPPVLQPAGTRVHLTLMKWWPGKMYFREPPQLFPFSALLWYGEIGRGGEPFKYSKHPLEEMAAVCMGTAHTQYIFFFPSMHSGHLVTSPCLIYLAVSLRGKAAGWVCYSLWMFCSTPAYLHSVLSDEYSQHVSKCLESFLVDVVPSCTVNILLCHL